MSRKNTLQDRANSLRTMWHDLESRALDARLEGDGTIATLLTAAKECVREAANSYRERAGDKP